MIWRTLVLCGLVAPAGGASSQAKPEVLATSVPTAYLAERIGGAAVDVTCTMPPNVEVARWHPTRKDVVRMQRAPLLLVHGASYEPWTDLVSLPLASTVVTTRSFRDRLLPAFPIDRRNAHVHGREGAREAGAVDPRTWLDPGLCALEALAVRDALERRFPASAECFEANHAALVRELDAWGADLERVSRRLAGRPLLASGNGYAYLARRERWNVTTLRLDGRSAPDAATTRSLAELREAGARVVLFESAPEEQVTRALVDAGLRVVVFTTGETRSLDADPPERDWLVRMRDNVSRLEGALLESE